MDNAIAIAGIHTGIGKTVVSAVVAEAMGWDYWKPVQAGMEEQDAASLRNLLTNGPARVHEEAVRLTQPMSPHAAAAIDGVSVDYTTFAWPQTSKTLLVETAGGLLSPMSDTTTMADFVQHYQLPVILVVQHYLGSINHTLLTLEVIKRRGIKLLGIVVNGHEQVSSASFIQNYAPTRLLASVPHLAELSNATISACAADVRAALQRNLMP